MKTHYKDLLITALVLFAGSFSAQVSAYQFFQQPTTYAAITGGTVFGTPTSDDDYFCNGGNPTLSQATGPGIQIGFTFTFNSIPYDVFGIQNNGWISFGQSSVTPNPVNLQVSNAYTGISGTSTSPAALQHRIAGLSRDIQGNGGSLRAETIGSSPNRTCVIQWSNYRVFAGSDNFSFQIRLVESSNIVQVVYGPWVTVTSTSGGEVGLRGATNADYNNRNVTSPNVWATSIAGTANTALCNWNTTGLFPQTGQKYEWLPPVPCTIPPPSNVVSTFTNVCPGASVLLSMSLSYTNAGYTYQWQSSSSGTAGAFSNMTGTNPAISSGTLSTSMAYRAVITCTNGNTTTTATPILVNVGAPDVSSALATLSLICPGTNGSLTLSQNYAGLGVNYQWQSATASPVGPYANVSGTNAATSGTLATLLSPSLTLNTYYKAILSCSANPGFSTVTNVATINIAGTTTNNVPYNEGFEGLSINNQLPNCSWAASNLPTICQTYTLANANNRIPHNGAKFAAFKSGTNPNGDYFYSNGIQMYSGITYSGAVWYTTDGVIGWSNISLLYGTTQTTTGLTSIASVTGAVSGTFYQLLNNTFQVPTSGIYYIAVKCIGNATPQFLSFDDLSVTIPCSLNSPTPNITISSQTICANDLLSLSASGADSYSWSTGSTANSTTDNPQNAGINNYTLVTTSTLSGCESTTVIPILVKSAPVVLVSASPPTVCAGQPVTLSALGNAVIFNWTNGSTQPAITVTTNATASYTVTGVGVNGCSSAASKSIAAVPLPNVSVTSSIPGDACPEDDIQFTANGGLSYQWLSSNSSVIMQGNQITLKLNSSTSFTVTGTNASNCAGKFFFSQNITTCVGIEKHNAALGMKVYPNPTNGEFVVETNNALMKNVELSDLSGRIILQTNSSDEKVNLDLKAFANGVYYVKISSNESSSVIKIVKQ